MRQIHTITIFFLLATVSLSFFRPFGFYRPPPFSFHPPRFTPQASPQNPNLKYLTGQWIITSVIGYDTNIPVRFDADDIHIQYGNQKILTYTLSGQRTIKFTPNKKINHSSGLNNPTQIQIQNAFSAICQYQFLDKQYDDLNVKDAFGKVLVTLTKATAQKARNKVRDQIRLRQNQMIRQPRYRQNDRLC